MSTPVFDEFVPVTDGVPVVNAKHVDFGGGDIADGIIYANNDNMIPCPYYNASGYSNENATFTYDSLGFITINKSSSSANRSQFFLYNTQTINLVEGKKYTLSINAISGTGAASVYFANRVNESGTIKSVVIGSAKDSIVGKSASVTFTYSKSTGWVNDLIAIYVEPTDKCTDLKVEVMLEEGGAAHKYMPYIYSRKSLRDDIEALKAR